ncbi:hypothetical protein [Leptospira sp. GIMC2001]|uniref:hypothetical protein n=1 Tax=Leptospira sp. GIMC2001 TaxID=1513297 RepID=UPI00234B33CB|nr:hypothetical protein [Leptospira sp. GIMC2001]WCL48861.1 hypothetical protein O4O04_16375 [Leptospira sp. GIMC2001]
MEQKSELNPELFEMVRTGKLSSSKILGLIHLKSLVDSYATKPFVENEKLEEIKAKFGVYPDIISWGDYFQTEIASRYFDETDERFKTILETIRFDLVSANLIFAGKPDNFRDRVRSEALISKSIDSYLWSFENEENVHLEILLDYYENLGLGEKPLPTSERIWYEGFDLNELQHRAVV